MKNTILTVAVMLTIGLTGAFANVSEEINQRAVASFSKDFVSASNVTWEQQKNYAKATFKLNNRIMFAYYNADGELMAVIRNILSDQLPIRLMTEVKNKYNDYWVSDLFEIATPDQTGYYVTIENGDEKVILKADGYGHWTVYKREKKNGVSL
jgi:hypothetical protein